IDNLYKDVNGYGLSFNDRTGPLEEEKSFIYGEVLLESLLRMLDPLNPQPGEKFYDLGSGTGKFLMSAHLLYPFGKCLGVEFLPSLHAEAQRILDRYNTEIRPALPEPRGEVEFRHGDMRDVDLTDVDIIYMHATCFSEDLQNTLRDKFQSCKPGT